MRIEHEINMFLFDFTNMNNIVLILGNVDKNMYWLFDDEYDGSLMSSRESTKVTIKHFIDHIKDRKLNAFVVVL